MGPIIASARPVSIRIPSIAVSSTIVDVGLTAQHTVDVPVPSADPAPDYNDAFWYEYSPTPGALGPSVILGHIDSAADGPALFFRLAAVRPGDEVFVTLADHVEATFKVTGVRSYLKSSFPTTTVYGNTDFAALRLITCGGSFDPTTGHYLSNIVVFASLVSSRLVS